MKHEAQQILIRDYTYHLPADKIANFPLPDRDASRLLIYRNGDITEDRFSNLDQHLPPGSDLVLNNTRVIEARIFFRKLTGASIEIFCLEPFGESVEQALQNTHSGKWLCLIGGASKWKPGQVLEKKLQIDQTEILLKAKYESKQSDSFVIEFSWTGEISFSSILHAAGNIPLPPYIKRQVGEADKERYQTVFSRPEGSVAAPTAA